MQRLEPQRRLQSADSHHGSRLVAIHPPYIFEMVNSFQDEWTVKNVKV